MRARLCFSKEGADDIVACDTALLKGIPGFGLNATIEPLEEGEWPVEGGLNLAAAETVPTAVSESAVKNVAYHGHTGGDPTSLSKPLPPPLLLSASNRL